MKKLPTWAIYLADFMCVLSALLIAWNYFRVGLPMENLTVFLCSLMILGAVAMVCVAQFFAFKYTKLANEKSKVRIGENVEENFQILFKQVTAIKRDNATLNANFTSLLNRFNDIADKAKNNTDKDKILADFATLNTKIEELEARFIKEDDLSTLKLEIDESLENLRADVEIDLSKLDDIDKAVKELKAILEEVGNNVVDNDGAEGEIEGVATQEPAEVINNDALEQEASKEEAINDDEYFEDDDFEDNFEDDGVDPSDDLSQISLMSRALNNTQQSQSILGRFAKINESMQEYEPEVEPEDETEESLSEEENSFDDLADIDDDLADIMSLDNEEPSETVLTINAMLGLGNKPYIRGTYAELSESQGVQMDFVEIGKWRYVFKDLKEKAKVSIWLNDEKISDNGDIFINEGEFLEIDINFSE